MDFDRWLTTRASPGWLFSWVVSWVVLMAVSPLGCSAERKNPDPAAASSVSRAASARESSAVGPVSKLMCDLIHKYVSAMADLNDAEFGDWLAAQAVNADVLVPCIERLQAVEAVRIPYGQAMDCSACMQADGLRTAQPPVCSPQAAAAVDEYLLLEDWQNVLRRYVSWDETDSGRNMSILAALCLDPSMEPMCQPVRDMFRASLPKECTTRCD